MSSSNPNRNRNDNDDNADDDDDDVSLPVRPKHSYSFEEMIECIDVTLLTLFAELPEDEWIPWKETDPDDQPTAKKRKMEDPPLGAQQFVAMPTNMLLEICGYLEPHETLSMLQCCKSFHDRKSEFHDHRVSAVRKLFALLPRHCNELEESIIGGWKSLVEFLTEVHRKMALAYGEYRVPSLHSALVGERVMVSLCAKHNTHQSFHELSHKGISDLDKQPRNKPTFGFCFDPKRFTSPYVQLGDSCEYDEDDEDDHDDNSYNKRFDYVGVPFLMAPDHCGGWDYNITVGAPTSTTRGACPGKGVAVYYVGESGIFESDRSPFGWNWPSLMSYFCMDTYRNASYAESRIHDWEAWSVAWLLERQLPPFHDDNECVTMVPWSELISSYEDNDQTFDDGGGILAEEEPTMISNPTLRFLSTLTH